MTKTLTEVRQARSLNTPAIFNMASAMKALASTPAKVRKSGALGGINGAIVQCCREVGTPLAINQILAMLQAGGFPDAQYKNISDRCWNLAHGHPKKTDTAEVRAEKEKKAPLVNISKGMYQIKA